jgi:hypothetical protein
MYVCHIRYKFLTPLIPHSLYIFHMSFLNSKSDSLKGYQNVIIYTLFTLKPFLNH